MNEFLLALLIVLVTVMAYGLGARHNEQENRRKYNEEVDEFNAGYEAARRGEPIESEPDNTPYDVWDIGWVWGKYHTRPPMTVQVTLTEELE